MPVRMQNTYNAAAAGSDSTLLTVSIPRRIEPFSERTDLSSIVAQEPLAQVSRDEQNVQDHYRGSEYYFG